MPAHSKSRSLASLSFITYTHMISSTLTWSLNLSNQSKWRFLVASAQKYSVSTFTYHTINVPCPSLVMGYGINTRQYWVSSRDVGWSKFIGTGKERNGSRLKKIFLFPLFFRFFSYLERVFPLFPFFLGISHPVLRRSFPVFSSFHLSNPIPYFLMGLKLAILERVLNENLSKPVPRRSWNHSFAVLKIFLGLSSTRFSE